MKQQTTNNKQQRGLKKVLFLLIFPLLLCSMLYVVHSARAQTIPAQIFTVIPPRLELKAKPGDFVKKTIQFRNEGEETAYLTVIPKDFIVKETSGQPEFVTSLVSGRWSASSWIKLSPSSLAVPPKSTINVNLTVNIPLDALPGGHYAGVLYESMGSPTRVGQGVGAGPAVQQIVGTLVYLIVDGPVTENALIQQFYAPSFLEYGPVPFTTEIVNQSDLHITPQGQITVRDMFGKTMATLKIDERNIFPGASLIYKNTWAEKNLIGRFRADLELAYGQGRGLKGTIFFWVFPWKVALAVTLAIILLALVIFLITKKIRKQKEELEEKLLEEKEEVEELKEQIKHKH